MNSAERFQLWSSHTYFDAATRKELERIAGDSVAIQDRFGQVIPFGTAGLRGLMQAGTNRMNRYTVRLATIALAKYLCQKGTASRGVVIAYDTRRHSAEFAQEAAETLSAFGVESLLCDQPQPAPFLSFAVRHVGAAAGVMITASHNPAGCNGYKVIGEDGGQIEPEVAEQLARLMRENENLPALNLPEPDPRLVRPTPPFVWGEYMDQIVEVFWPPVGSACRVLYTPLHGAGLQAVRSALYRTAHEVRVVESQSKPDPNFSTVETPNPEDPAVFAHALKIAESFKPDLILGTDPDADRLAAMAPGADGQYAYFTGNQLGALLLDHHLSALKERRMLPQNGYVVKSRVTSGLIDAICRSYGVEVVETPVGFRHIAAVIREREAQGQPFLFAVEESLGYLAAPFVRDKDAVMAAVLAAEAAGMARDRGRTLWDVLAELWEKHGHFREAQFNLAFTGPHAADKMWAILLRFRQAPHTSIADQHVTWMADYDQGWAWVPHSKNYQIIPAEQNGGLFFRLDHGGFLAVRPSGTEPKLKVYLSVAGATAAEAEERLRRLAFAVRGLTVAV